MIKREKLSLCSSIIFLISLVSSASAANWYVIDTGTRNSASSCASFGTSWTTAWSNTDRINWA